METDNSPPRRLRLFLRDHRIMDADALVPQGQHLSTYLATRNRYLNLTDVSWLGTGENVEHLALKVANILWAASEDGEVSLGAPRAMEGPRRVEVELEGGYVVAAGLLLVADQRLSDYLQSSPMFIPLRDAVLMPRRKPLGDVVVNQEFIQMVREITETGVSPPPAREPAEVNATAESPRPDD
ncbi:MAG: hypothetical protein GWN02_34530 [Gemmatimonadetes bacterium]|nr:hypothetical protein [Gemmatimonadota bacterium]